MSPAEEAGAGGRVAAAGLVVTTVLAVFLILRFRQVELAVHLYLVALAGLGSALVGGRALGRLAWAQGPSLTRWLRERRRRWHPERVRQLEELEHAVDFSLTTAFDVHYRLRPHLVRIAGHRLAAQRGLSLESSPDVARRALGDAAWELVRPDREPPPERNARGTDLRVLRAVVGALESL